MVDRRVVGQVRVPVRVADRHVVRDVVVGAVDRQDPLRGEAVDGRHHRRRHQPAVGQRQEVEVVAHQVELAGPLERGRVVQALVHLGVDAGVLLVAARGLGVQPGRGQRVGGGEQRDVVAERDQALGESGRDLLPRPVAARRGAMRDRGEHADAQARRAALDVDVDVVPVPSQIASIFLTRRPYRHDGFRSDGQPPFELGRSASIASLRSSATPLMVNVGRVVT